MDGPPPHDPPLDTPLARWLHARGRVPLEQLRGALEASRRLRAAAAPHPGAVGPDDALLARLLVERGALGAAEADAALAALAPARAGPRESQRLAARARWAPGLVVGGAWRLVDRLGQGGMGSVDLVEHVETGARCALKSIPAASDPDLVLRFRREGEALARVDRHPNVVRVHAAGHDEGRLWLVMDLAEGGDLAARLRAGPLALEDALALGEALAQGLAHAHRHGVLHRDLKPSNVLFDAQGAPRLTDFGLARLADGRSLTRSGDLLGTPAYMAPEQATGARDRQDERTDVFGLGALLFHAVTGRPPFDAPTTYAALALATRGVVADPRALRPDLSPAFAAALRRALAPRPEDRFPSARDLALALARAREAPEGAGPAAGRRRAALVAAGAAAALGLALAMAGTSGGPDAPAGPTTERRPHGARPKPGSLRPAASTGAGPEVGRHLATATDDLPAPVPPALHAIAAPPRAPPARLARASATWGAWTDALGGDAGAAASMRVFVGEVMRSTDLKADPEVAGAALRWSWWLARHPHLLPDEAQAWAWDDLGRAFQEGWGVTRDPDVARYCYARAFERGSAASAARLAGTLALTPAPPSPEALARALPWAERGLEASRGTTGEAQRDPESARISADIVGRIARGHPDLLGDAAERLQARLTRGLAEEPDPQAGTWALAAAHVARARGAPPERAWLEQAAARARDAAERRDARALLVEVGAHPTRGPLAAWCDEAPAEALAAARGDPWLTLALAERWLPGDVHPGAGAALLGLATAGARSRLRDEAALALARAWAAAVAAGRPPPCWLEEAQDAVAAIGAGASREAASAALQEALARLAAPPADPRRRIPWPRWEPPEGLPPERVRGWQDAALAGDVAWSTYLGGLLARQTAEARREALAHAARLTRDPSPALAQLGWRHLLAAEREAPGGTPAAPTARFVLEQGTAAGDAECQLELGWALLDDGPAAAARGLALLRDLVARPETHDEAALERAAVVLSELARAGGRGVDLAEARAALERATTGARDTVWARGELARVLVAQGALDEAGALLRRGATKAGLIAASHATALRELEAAAAAAGLDGLREEAAAALALLAATDPVAAVELARARRPLAEAARDLLALTEGRPVAGSAWGTDEAAAQRLNEAVARAWLALEAVVDEARARGEALPVDADHVRTRAQEVAAATSPWARRVLRGR